MKLVKQILAGIDFQPNTEAVLRTASLLAKKMGSQVALLHVVPPVASLALAEEYGDVRTLVALARKESAERLAEYGVHLKEEGVSVTEPVVLEGVAFDKIIAHSDDLDANVILVGAGLPGGEKRRGLGITAERLCRKSSRPVWLVKSDSKAAPGSIVCPVDFSEPSVRALKNAIFLARTFGTELVVLTVVPPVSTLYGWVGQDRDKIQAAQAEQHERSLDAFLGQFDFHDVSWRKVVRTGPPDREILAVVENVQADLIVMGSVGRTGFSRILLGSVAESVLQAMPCSMLLVKAEDTFRLQAIDQVADIESHFEHGAELLKQGFVEEARRQFRHCVSANVMFAPGWEALADCYERLQDPTNAEECRGQAKQVRDTLSWRKIEADVRSRHPLWRRGG
jgi:nucleotide-binding universal stress UspA family protein